MSVRSLELTQRWGEALATVKGGARAGDITLRRWIFWERVVLLPLLALVALAFLTFGTVQVSGLSMQPQFHTGDRLFFVKPYSWLSPLQSGDIVVINKKYGPRAGVHLIKRVFFVQNADGNALWPAMVKTSRGNVDPKEFFPQYVESYPDRKTVGKNQILVVGDNFDNSEDSRDEETGAISRDEIMGKVILR